MSESRSIHIAKIVSLVSLLVLLSVTYLLRRELLSLSHIRFASDEARALYDMKELKASYPERVKQHEIAMQHYERELKHYRVMLDLYQNDREQYIKLVKGKYQPPNLPHAPRKPDSPELSKKLYELNAEFRSRKNEYFANALVINVLAWTAAIGLVGGLVYLLLFDSNSARWHYLAMLLMSFVFLIGPSFHSIISTAVGLLNAPRAF